VKSNVELKHSRGGSVGRSTNLGEKSNQELTLKGTKEGAKLLEGRKVTGYRERNRQGFLKVGKKKKRGRNH